MARQTVPADAGRCTDSTVTHHRKAPGNHPCDARYVGASCCHVALDKRPLKRRERAENVKKREVFSKYGPQARAVLETLLIPSLSRLGFMFA